MADPSIEHRAAQAYVGIRTRATLKEWSRVNALVGDIFGWLEEHRVRPAGPPFYRYRTVGDERVPFDVEVGVPVDGAPDAEPPVRAGTIPEASYVRMLHHGHPDRLEELHDAIRMWAAREGIRLKRAREGEQDVWAGLYEFYLTDPADEPDLNEWMTEVLYQVA